MSQAPAVSTDLIEHITSNYHNDPLGYVRFAFPWGKAGTMLANEPGPDKMQADVLEMVGELCRAGKDREIGQRIAVKSGNGVGKSTAIAFLLLWMMSCRHHCQAIVTANTQIQLVTTTWREIALWRRMAINDSWFTQTATRLYVKGCEETWFATATPWSKENADAFKGRHAQSAVGIFFDEASGIDDVIWDFCEGNMTTGGAWWFAFGNPEYATGRFKECWGRFAKRWHLFTIDAREARKTNKAQIQAWIEDYGEDDDFVRVRVYGEFPRQSIYQLIPTDLVEMAMRRPQPDDKMLAQFPKLLGVDVARSGMNQTVFCRRQGPFVYPLYKHRGIDLMQTSGICTDIINEFDPHAVFIDAVGVGAGVVDRLRQLGYNPVEVQSAAKATDPRHLANKRAEMWVKMADWFRREPCLPRDQEFLNGLTSPKLSHDNKNRRRIEKKEDMIARGVQSPDEADALALTFAENVDLGMSVKASTQRPKWASKYKPHSSTTWMSS